MAVGLLAFTIWVTSTCLAELSASPERLRRQITTTLATDDEVRVELSPFGNHVAIVGGVFRLVCVVHGYRTSPIEVFWTWRSTMDEQTVSLNAHLQHYPNYTRHQPGDKYLLVTNVPHIPVEESGQTIALLIYDLSYDDDGLYSCGVHNKVDSYIKEKYQLVVHGPPNILPTETIINGIIGFHVDIKVEFQSRPPVTNSTWFGKNGTQLFKNNTKFVFRQSIDDFLGYVILMITDFQLADRGLYKLKLGNVKGNQTIQFNLEANPFVEVVSPNVSSSMLHPTFFYGTTAVFDCRANNFKNRPVFAWKLGGKRLAKLRAKNSVNETSFIIRSGHVDTWISRVTIRGITFDFIGVLDCSVAQNGSIYHDRNIIDVNGSPVIHSHTRTIRAKIGSTVELKCNVSSSPPATRLQWLFREEVIQFSESTSDVRLGSQIEMSLNVEVTSADAYGNYMCQAVNVYGSNGYSIKINAEPPHVCESIFCAKPEICDWESEKCMCPVGYQIHSGACTAPTQIQTSAPSYLWAGVGAGSVLIVALFSIVVLFMCWKKRSALRKKPDNRPYTTAAYSHAQYASANIYEIITRPSDEFPRERLRFLHAIGIGKFGRVMKAEALSINRTGAWEEVAVKMCQESATNLDKEDLYNELKIIRTIPKHVNVVSFFGACTYGEPLLLILEFVPGGDLQNYLRRRRPDSDRVLESPYCEVESPFKMQLSHDEEDNNCELTAKDLLSFVLQTSRGMQHLVDHDIVHRDVAARNVLIGYNGVCKISDFGLARNVEGVDVYERTSKGPLPIRWMAPESLMEGSHSHKADVWGFGILLWEIVTLGASPYSTMTLRGVIDAVVTGKRLERPQHCMDELYSLMTKCWEHLPRDRPTFNELSEHIEFLLEKEADYIQLDQFQEAVYMVLEDPQSMDERL